MIVTIKNDDGEFLFDINKIADEDKKQEAGVIVQKVGNLSVIIEALDYIVSFNARNRYEWQAHRSNDIVNRFNLFPKLLGHGRPIGFVLRVDFVSAVYGDGVCVCVCLSACACAC